MTEIEDPDWTTPEEAEEFVVKLKARIRVLEAALRALWDDLSDFRGELHPATWKQVREALNEAK